MAKEKSNARRVGKKNPLRLLTCNMHLLSTNFMGLIVESQRESLEQATPVEKLSFYLMKLSYKKNVEAKKIIFFTEKTFRFYR